MIIDEDVGLRVEDFLLFGMRVDIDDIVINSYELYMNERLSGRYNTLDELGAYYPILGGPIGIMSIKDAARRGSFNSYCSRDKSNESDY